MRRLVYILLLGSFLLWMAKPSPAAFQPRPGRLIEWGWNTPKATYIKDHIAEMEQVPFDGLAIDLKANFTGTSFAFNDWSATVLPIGNYSQDVSAFKRTAFNRFQNNFLRFNVTPGDIDWFDPNFNSVLTNVTSLAQVAKDGKAKGILFDVEIYAPTGGVWDYESQLLRTTYTFDQYKQQVRTRGQQFMQAMQSVYPEITVLTTFGYYTPFTDARYDLLPSFLDGMLDVANSTNLIFDGWEYAYGYTTDSQFANAYDIMRNQGLAWTANPAKYQSNYRSSFALWVDYGATWYPTNVTMNYFTPEGFTTSLNYAASYSEGYVWIYSQMANWWATSTSDPGYVPQAYKDALAQVVRHRETEQFWGVTKDSATWYEFSVSAQISQDNLLKLYGYSYDTVGQQGQADYTTKTVQINLGDKLSVEVTPKLTGSLGRGGIILTDNSGGQTTYTLNDSTYVGILWQSGSGGELLAYSKTDDGLTQVPFLPVQPLNTKYIYQIERVNLGQARLTVLDAMGTSLDNRTVALNGVQPKLYIALCAQAVDMDFDSVWVTRASQIPGDINFDGLVDSVDTGIMTANWGIGPGATVSQGDVSGDGFVDSADLYILAENWGSSMSW